MHSETTILAIETSTSCCSVALLVNGKKTARRAQGSTIHSEVVLSMIDELIALQGIQKKDIDVIAVSKGPGSFTGLRIGIGVAQGLAFSINAKICALTSLHILAHSVPGEGLILAALDARMNEVYWGVYRKQADEMKLISSLHVTAPEEVCLSDSLIEVGEVNVYCVGNAWQAYQGRFASMEKVDHRIDEEGSYPDAEYLADLAEIEIRRGRELIEPADLSALYVRDNVAKKSLQQ